jgi:hypothetical protein
MNKNDSYEEIKKSGISIHPVIIWFERADSALHAYILRNGVEEIVGTDFESVGLLGVEMTPTAKKQLSICHLQLVETNEIQMECIRETLIESVNYEYRQFRQPLQYSDYYYTLPIPTYVRRFYIGRNDAIFDLEAVYDHTQLNECQISYVWRTSRYTSLYHLFNAVLMDYEILRLIC